MNIDPIQPCHQCKSPIGYVICDINGKKVCRVCLAKHCEELEKKRAEDKAEDKAEESFSVPNVIPDFQPFISHNLEANPKGVLIKSKQQWREELKRRNLSDDLDFSPLTGHKGERTYKDVQKIKRDQQLKQQDRERKQRYG